MRNPFRTRRPRQQPADPTLPPGYPPAYAQQEEQILAQISARRRAFMDRSGQNEQQFTGAVPQQTEMVTKKTIPGAMEEEKAVGDLFSGNIFD